MRTRTSKRVTSRRPRVVGCRVRYDLSIGMLTGLVRHSEVPWDTPDTWWVYALVTFVVGDDVRRTDGYEIGVVMEPGALAAGVKARLQFLLDRIGAIEATVTHVIPPMTAETIGMIREINAALVKERMNHRAGSPQGGNPGTKDTEKSGGEEKGTADERRSTRIHGSERRATSDEQRVRRPQRVRPGPVRRWDRAAAGPGAHAGR